ncbi:DUF2971 domain-containing protein [Fibrobacter sp. UWB4]|uniref:DUF2971 domain-containing protein n=1 Tax=Fibrobacter sp. UWB4 TaxID=1964356 RepID=UPI0015958810|nr:DUF2971 domain-containing protein [Fibrobacter sp. UWB4]
MNSMFYKFLHDDENHTVLKSCLDGNLLFSRIPELNDFSETFAVADKEEIDRSLAEMRRDGCSEEEQRCFYEHVELMEKVFPEFKNVFESFKSLNLSRPFPFSQIGGLIQMVAGNGLEINPLNKMMNILPSFLQLTNELIQDRVGIFCVSEDVDNFPMWAHYADNAKGFVVEYKNLEVLFCGDGTKMLNQIQEVDYYGVERPAVSLKPDKLNALFFSKQGKWSYETEWRVVKPLAECKKKSVGCGSERSFFKMENPKDYISRIIVGWNGNLEEVKSIVDEKMGVPVVQANVVNGNIEIPQK